MKHQLKRVNITNPMVKNAVTNFTIRTTKPINSNIKSILKYRSFHYFHLLNIIRAFKIAELLICPLQSYASSFI